jgi:cytochrome c biogenesis factor
MHEYVLLSVPITTAPQLGMDAHCRKQFVRKSPSVTSVDATMSANTRTLIVLMLLLTMPPALLELYVSRGHAASMLHCDMSPTSQLSDVPFVAAGTPTLLSPVQVYAVLENQITTDTHS